MSVDFNWARAIATSPIFLVLIGCSIVTLAVAIERAVYFWKRRGNPEATVGHVLNRVRAGELAEATWACSATPHPIGPVAAQLFEGGDPQSEVVEEKLVVALSEQKLLLERNLGVLGSMAAIAPLIGLLGTVWGIMRAFQDMALSGSAAPSVVAAGVAEALTTTAAGLVVAVPAVVLFNHFTRQMNVMLTVAENGARSIRTALTETGDGQAWTVTEGSGKRAASPKARAA